jgi:hypothetical protein
MILERKSDIPEYLLPQSSYDRASIAADIPVG